MIMHMKKLLLLFLCIAALVSCGGDEGVLGPDSGNPLSECALPDTVQAGSELVLQWNGFEDAAAIALKSSAVEYDLEVEVVTSSGLIALVPREVTPGVYDVMLTQSVSMKLGAVEVTPADPESGSDENPDTGDEPGTDPEPEPGTDPEPEPGTDPDPGVDPEPGPEPPVDPEVPVEKKKLVRLEMTPYLGSAQQMIAWDIEPEVLRISVTDLTDNQVAYYDGYYVSSSPFSYDLLDDGFEESENIEIDYVMSSDGNVQTTELVRYKGTDSVTWMYDQNGRITEVSSSKQTYLSIGYTGDNISSFSSVTFEYGDPSLVNNAEAADPIWGYMSLTTNGYKEPFLYIPYLMGWYRPQSAALPTSMSSPSSDGEGVDTSSLNYDFDEDGYVTGMSWKSGSTQCKVKYIYE